MHTLLSANFYSIFYWLTVADSVKSFFDTTSNIFTWIAVISGICVIVGTIAKSGTIADENLTTTEEEQVNPEVRAWESFRRYSTRIFYVMLSLSLITWAGYVFTPNKKDCLLIVAGGAVGNFITRDSSASSVPHDVFEYLHLSLKDEIKNIGKEDEKDAKKEVAATPAPAKPVTVKDELLEKAKKLTKEQLIEYLQSDTSLVK